MWDYTAGLGVILYAVAGLRFKNTKESEIGAEYGKKGIKAGCWRWQRNKSREMLEDSSTAPMHRVPWTERKEIP